MKKRVDFARHPRDEAMEAIEEGRKDDAKKYVQRMWEEARPLHDLDGDAQACLLTFIAKNLGEEAVEEALRYMGEELWKPVVMSVKEKGTKALAELFGSFLRAHGSDFFCEEDEEKFVFVSRYCPSGGRMMNEGKQDISARHPFAFGTTKKPYPWSFSQPGILYYCCHCAVLMDMLPREWGWGVLEVGFGRQFDDEGNPIDEPCKLIIHKEPE